MKREQAVTEILKDLSGVGSLALEVTDLVAGSSQSEQDVFPAIDGKLREMAALIEAMKDKAYLGWRAVVRS